MSEQIPPMLIRATARSHDFWAAFREEADAAGLPYTRALEQGAQMWLLARNPAVMLQPREPAAPPVLPQPAPAAPGANPFAVQPQQDPA